MTLTDLQAIAVQRSPIVRQAEADVASARGAMIQAGTPQNPTAGFEGDTIGTGYTGGYQGIAVEQVVPMGGKLRLARAAKEMDFKNAQVALRRTYFDVFTTVRTNYFATLVAAETLKINRALAQFTDEVYRVQIDRVKAGEAAPYEPMQVRVLAFQAHAAVVQSSNAYLSAWRQLAAALCAPDMPPTQLVGDVKMPVPNVSYEAAYRWIMEHNTKLTTARNAACGAQFALTLARRTPWVPDLDISAAIQQDYTTEPGRPWVYSLKSSVAIPLWDKNRGNILAAEGALAHANQGYAAARDSLAGTLADAYARYDANKVDRGLLPPGHHRRPGPVVAGLVGAPPGRPGRRAVHRRRRRAADLGADHSDLRADARRAMASGGRSGRPDGSRRPFPDRRGRVAGAIAAAPADLRTAAERSPAAVAALDDLA